MPTHFYISSSIFLSSTLDISKIDTILNYCLSVLHILDKHGNKGNETQDQIILYSKVFLCPEYGLFIR